MDDVLVKEEPMPEVKVEIEQIPWRYNGKRQPIQEIPSGSSDTTKEPKCKLVTSNEPFDERSNQKRPFQFHLDMHVQFIFYMHAGGYIVHAGCMMQPSSHSLRLSWVRGQPSGRSFASD